MHWSNDMLGERVCMKYFSRIFGS